MQKRKLAFCQFQCQDYGSTIQISYESTKHVMKSFNRLSNSTLNLLTIVLVVYFNWFFNELFCCLYYCIRSMFSKILTIILFSRLHVQAHKFGIDTWTCDRAKNFIGFSSCIKLCIWASEPCPIFVFVHFNLRLQLAKPRNRAIKPIIVTEDEEGEKKTITKL